MWKDDDVFLQIPHFNEDKIRRLRKKKKNISLEEFCKLTPQERGECEIFDSKEEREDCEYAI